jgi:glyoxylase-like metal-dependent hydrolase (beta-lactamase superfamily II)
MCDHAARAANGDASLAAPVEVETLVDGRVEVRRLVVGPLRTNTYVLRHAASGNVIVVDPGDEPERVLDALAGAPVDAIVCTHCHWDHVQAVDTLRRATGAAVAAHDAERAVWAHECAYLEQHGHWDWALADAQRPTGAVTSIGWDGRIDVDLATRRTLRLGDVTIGIRHTPGHSPGSVSLTAPGWVITGDTLFPGGPGLTGWPLSDFATIITSIRRRLFTLPGTTRVLPGHGAPTTIAAEAPHLPEWVARGW